MLFRSEIDALLRDEARRATMVADCRAVMQEKMSLDVSVARLIPMIRGRRGAMREGTARRG